MPIELVMLYPTQSTLWFYRNREFIVAFHQVQSERPSATNDIATKEIKSQFFDNTMISYYEVDFILHVSVIFSCVI
ncbi:unnamed protein product [Leptidea sinapis]|uniref:Uncharacterized protein n=1 Tax=Leptidea sinapis TaxID=189913 RepID=A0A5E4R7I9_9NEOP|nr:unnamed protein product [Leptidea sinapis]